MWWVKSEAQELDPKARREYVRKEFGPDFGVDYARFSDPPDVAKDMRLEEKIREDLNKYLPLASHLDVRVRNGFVILKGHLRDHEQRWETQKLIKSITGVVEIISGISIDN